MILIRFSRSAYTTTRRRLERDSPRSNWGFQDLSSPSGAGRLPSTLQDALKLPTGPSKTCTDGLTGRTCRMRTGAEPLASWSRCAHTRVVLLNLFEGSSADRLGPGRIRYPLRAGPRRRGSNYQRLTANAHRSGHEFETPLADQHMDASIRYLMLADARRLPRELEESAADVRRVPSESKSFPAGPSTRPHTLSRSVADTFIAPNGCGAVHAGPRRTGREFEASTARARPGGSELEGTVARPDRRGGNR